MPKEWSVRIEASHDGGQERGLKVVDRVMILLREYAAVGSGGPTSLGMQMSVTADSLESAFAKGIKTFTGAVLKVGMPHKFRVVDVEVESPEHFEARLNEPDPEVIGVAELAALLGVSRPRASAIAARRDFPAPYVRLASGPVWIKANLSRWLDEWQRRPNVTRERAHATSVTSESRPVFGMAAKGS